MPDGDSARDPRNTHVRNTRAKWALVAASIVFLAGYSLLILLPGISEAARNILIVLLGLIWAVFILDFIVRLVRARRGERWRFVGHNKLDLLSTIIPIVRPFHVLSGLNSVRGFRGRSGNSVRSRVIVTALAYASLFVYVIALTEYAVERDAPGATILTFGNAVWWACVTIATVGYGDYVPVTPIGRILAVVLMAGGLVIIGTASATIVSYLNERMARNRENHKANETDTTGGD
jgi:voltage-gated potassium channel